ncbi:MAG: pentapeptide repeat-containing protein [Cyanobacteria bacterium J06638_28]
MTDRGKYHGQKLTAKTVLQLYAAGERDFRGAILRGCNFRGADLSGADLSGADIRSARFVDAMLRGVNFSYAKGGLQRRWVLGQLALVIVIAALAGVLQGYSGYILSFYFTTGEVTDLIAAITSVIVIAVMVFAIARQGFTIRALGSVAVAGAVAGAFAGAVAVAVAVAFAVAFAGAFAGAVAVAVAVAFAVAFAVAVAGAVAVAFAVAVAVAVAGAFAVAVAGAGAVAFAGAFAVAVAVAVAVAGAGTSIFLSLYINRRIRKGDPKFENLRIIGLAFAALGGTTFSGADLTHATFAHATLNSTNFADSRQRSTLLTRVRWHQAQKLDRARLGTSNLQDPRVRNLLTTLNGTDQDLSNADLRGANLSGAQLHRINLKGANLNGATLAGAELHGANLTEAQCVGTDFTGAQLTGACLEAWNIDETTVLKDIDCQYVFLKEHPDSLGNRERRPHNPDKVFQPGDFEKLFKEMLDTVQILIRNGVDPEAFRAAFEKVMADNPSITRDAIKAVEKQDNDVLLTLQVPEGTDKAQVERSWDEGYQSGLKAGYTSGLLEGQTQRADDVKEVALGFSQILSSIQINNMNNPINAGDGSLMNTGTQGNVNTGTMQGDVVNLGEISGQVTNQINQLADVPTSPDQPSLKDLLAQIQAAVEADTELSDDEKAEALGEVGKLAKAGKNPQASAMQRMAKRATDALKSITEPLTEASKLAAVCKTLLPTIWALF